MKQYNILCDIIMFFIYMEGFGGIWREWREGEGVSPKFSHGIAF